MSAVFHFPGIAHDRIARAVHRVLEATPLCSMATRGPGDQVHINTAFFAWSEALELFFLSTPDSVHCRNLAQSPEMAVAVFDSHQPWGERHRGLQLFGVGEPVPPVRLSEVEGLYARRFPRYREFNARDDAAFAALRFYFFRATALKLLDEEECGEATPIAVAVVRPDNR